MNKIAIAFLFLIVSAAATDVKKCSKDRPFPLDVRVQGCDVPPCDIIKGTDCIFEIDFVSYKYITDLNAQVRATTLGITVPYELPPEVAAACPNLMYGAYCPLYPTEDATYLFVFPIGNYPEISVKVEISLIDQDKDVTTCFVCDIKVKKGPTSTRHTIYEINFIDEN